ncbi:glycosyltransferase family 2 protein [Alloalcanivorax sp. C16-2]|uniref:glycosyltransferase family 2 protein n=1 Tax=Alloalcanivorax TaxID=3020832 RepID=UPI001EE4B3DC|nr:glycosyltransferase family 2 protein [Alloalcanivorax marinus]
MSIVIPAKNEAEGLGILLPELVDWAGYDELIVVSDGSSDATAEVARSYGAKVIVHNESMGNGASIKNGFREATGEWVLFMDGDGQHRVESVIAILQEMKKGEAAMVVGARSSDGQASKWRHLANAFYNRFASFVTGNKIRDLTSGLRIVVASRFSEVLDLLPNGFSYPTTSTMAFMRSGYVVRYVGVDVLKRKGRSHIRVFKDGMRFLLIIFKVATLYSPLKVFIPISSLLFLLGLVRYIYTYATMGTFTNMSALLMVSAVQVFLVGLVSEQITALMYQAKSRR